MSKLRPDTRSDSAAQAGGMAGKDTGYNKSSERILTGTGHGKPSRKQENRQESCGVRKPKDAGFVDHSLWALAFLELF